MLFCFAKKSRTDLASELLQQQYVSGEDLPLPPPPPLPQLMAGIEPMPLEGTDNRFATSNFSTELNAISRFDSTGGNNTTNKTFDNDSR